MKEHDESELFFMLSFDALKQNSASSSQRFCQLTSEGDSFYFFEASVPSQSISHLILVLSPVDAADVVSRAYGRQEKGPAQTW